MKHGCVHTLPMLKKYFLAVYVLLHRKRALPLHWETLCLALLPNLPLLDSSPSWQLQRLLRKVCCRIIRQRRRLNKRLLMKTYIHHSRCQETTSSRLFSKNLRYEKKEFFSISIFYQNFNLIRSIHFHWIKFFLFEENKKLVYSSIFYYRCYPFNDRIYQFIFVFEEHDEIQFDFSFHH